MIRFEDISVSFNNQYIFSGLNLHIRHGEKVLVHGKSGIGKSTLIKLLLGFTMPDSGRIFVEEILLDSASVWDIRRRIAYVSQDLEIGEGAVRSIIGDIFSYRATPSLAHNREGLKNYLNCLELDEGILDKSVEDLSRGERQRLAIIIALMMKRDIYILDEATSALDSRMKDKVIDIFTRSDWTAVIVSHDRDWLRGRDTRIFSLEGL